jgi:hypothetical protein
LFECDESLTWRGLNSNLGHLGSFTLSLYLVENRVYLSHDVQVVDMTWRAATRIVIGVEDLVQRTEDGRTGRVLGGWRIRRSGDIMCGLHRARGDEEHRFLG